MEKNKVLEVKNLYVSFKSHGKRLDVIRKYKKINKCVII